MQRKQVNPFLQIPDMKIINQHMGISYNPLIAEYLFSGNANDTSGNNLNGTLYGSPSLSTPQPNALNLGNNKYMQIADNDLLSFTDGTKDLPFSISFKMKINSIISYNVTVIINKRTDNLVIGTNSEYQLSYSWGDQEGRLGLVFFLWDKINGKSISVQTNEQLTFGQEYSIIVTYDGSALETGLRIYVDDVDKSDMRANSGYERMGNTSAPVVIGRAGWWNGLYFNGYIDEIRIKKQY